MSADSEPRASPVPETDGACGPQPIVAYVAEGSSYRTVSGAKEIAALIEDAKATVWIDSCARCETGDEVLSKVLKLHPLVIEDIFDERVTPKVEDYGEYLYVVMHGVLREAESPENLATVEIDVVIGPNWVFTHHTRKLRSVEDLRTELNRNPRVLSRGPAYVAHALIDRLTDYYLPVVEKFDDEIDELENKVVHNPDPALLPHLFGMKRTLQKLRRISVYQREILQRLSRGEFEQIPPQALPFYRDVYDHFVRIADLADSYRELVGSALEIYMSVTANRANEIMKVLALISTIMLPLTFIAGVYGMNFEHMPELHWKYGYPFALGLMAVVATALAIWFKKRKWF